MGRICGHTCNLPVSNISYYLFILPIVKMTLHPFMKPCQKIILGGGNLCGAISFSFFAHTEERVYIYVRNFPSSCSINCHICVLLLLCSLLTVLIVQYINNPSNCRQNQCPPWIFKWMQINLMASPRESIIMQWTFALTDIMYANEIFILIYFHMDILSVQCKSTYSNH